MAEPAIDNSTSISESLDEINRRMEELNIPADSQDENRQTDKVVEDEALSLNADQGSDAEGLEDIAGNGPGHVPEESENQLSTEEASQSPEQSSITDDETGINISDDELWEDDDIEEIPLFEEEFLEEELDTEKKAQEPASDAPVAEDNLEHPAADSTEDEQQSENQAQAAKTAEKEKPTPESLSQETPEKPTKDHTENPSCPEDMEAQDKGQETAGSSFLTSLLPWIVTGVSAAFCVAAIFTIWLIASSAEQHNQLTTKHPKTNKKASEPAGQQKVPGLAMTPMRGTAQAIDLAPFLIPAQVSGDLVFFKLQVELITPNATTKQQLLKRLAWVRDIIYQELKGINISRGIKGDLLTRYRRPLLKRLNEELAPLRIEDVRLMGFLLR